MGRLNGKCIVVTGGAGGIGEASASLFAKEGAKVMLVDRDETALRSACERVGNGAAFVVADVSAEGDTRGYVQATVEKFGGLDVLFANAGTEGKAVSLCDTTAADFDRVIAVNVRGVFLAIREAAPYIAKRGGGSIMITSSIAGIVGSRNLSPYVASKHAVIGLAKCAALELAAEGIRVNTINPGPIENRMMRSLEEQMAPGAGESVKRGFEQMVALGRYGTNDEIARLALFLASDDSSYCTGSVFVADGGFTAQ